MPVTFLERNSREALLAEIAEVKPSAFICVYLTDDKHITVAGEWKSGRVTAMGMLAEALFTLSSKGD